MSFSFVNAPLTRSLTVSWSVVMTPDGATAFCAQGSGEQVGVEPVADQLRGRELDIDALVLLADQVDLGDIGHLQQPRAYILDIVAQLAGREPVRCESIDNAVRVAEFVVGDGADDALRQCQLDVLDLLAYLVPGVRHLLRPGGSLEIHEDLRWSRPFGQDPGRIS